MIHLHFLGSQEHRQEWVYHCEDGNLLVVKSEIEVESKPAPSERGWRGGGRGGGVMD
jgi:hypothetical protein